jgi:antitoxin component YwqK of YwqJK toxin-antitoxin module
VFQKKAVIVFLLFAFWGYSIGCGKKTKTKEEHYPAGKLEAIYTHNDAGKHDEVIIKYYPSGKIQKETTYKNNVKEGMYKEYDESGTLMVEANYKDDKRDGIYKRYNENGNLMIEGNYKNGEEVSETCYDEQGNKKQCP